MNSGNDHGRGYTWASILSTDAQVPAAQRNQVHFQVSPRLVGRLHAGPSATRPAQPIRTSAPRRYEGRDLPSSRAAARPGSAASLPRSGRRVRMIVGGARQLDSRQQGERVGVAPGPVPDGEHLARSLSAPPSTRAPGPLTVASLMRDHSFVALWPGRKRAQKTSPRLASTTEATSAGLAAVRVRRAVQG